MVQKNETARGLALVLLEEILGQGAYSNIALNKGLAASSLSPADKGLVTELVYGTLSHKIELEWYLSHALEDRDKLEPWVYYLLLLSLYQICYLDKIPAHALVHEAVKLAKRGRGAEKLVNAVLRGFLRDGLPDAKAIKRVNKRLSVCYSLPVWLVKVLLSEYGEKRGEQIMASLHERNKVSVRVVDSHDWEVLKEELGANPSLLSPLGLVKDKGHFASHPAFADGRLTIQDETSQLVAPVFGLQGDEQVLDACAAPGGKTCHLASYLTTGQVMALDLYPHKLALIEENAQRLGVSDRVVTRQLDACQVAATFGADSFDAILVDAPCSGMGLIRRKPDIRYNKEAMDFDTLAQIQLRILDSVCQTIKKGGIITYSTCTIVRQENQEVVQAFLAAHPEFEQVLLEHPLKDIMVDGCLLVTPEQYGTDGFFISQFRRRF